MAERGQFTSIVGCEYDQCKQSQPDESGKRWWQKSRDANRTERWGLRDNFVSAFLQVKGGLLDIAHGKIPATAFSTPL